MMYNRFVQVGLSAAIAAAFFSLVVVGIDVFVPHPDFPKERQACYEQFAPRRVVSQTGELTEEEHEEQLRREKEQRDCVNAVDEQEEPFLQNVFIIALLSGVAGVVAGSLLFSKILPHGASGMTFGGIATMLYGMVRGLPAVDRRVQFVVAVFALAVLLGVAWQRGRGLLHKDT